MKTLILLAALGLASCGPTTVIDSFCDTESPILIDRAAAEILVEEDRAAAEKIDSYNRYGEDRCGWQ